MTTRIKSTLQQLTLCTVAASSFLFTSASLADKADKFETRSAIVGFSDLNLSNPAGVAELYRRIKGTAHRLCANHNATTTLRSRSQAKCTREAVAEAVERMQNERLTALHREKTQRYG